jgi:FemAB-related protein (PEP-CTERM system-associated)
MRQTELCEGTAQEQAWDDFVEGHELSTVYHLTAWKHVVESVYGLKPQYVMLRTQGAVCGVLPAFEMRDLRLRNVIVSLPFANYGGPLAHSDDDVRALMEPLSERVADAFKYVLLKMPQASAFQAGMPQDSGYCSPYIKLPGTSEDMFQVIGTKTRNQVRKGWGLGLEAKSGAGTDLQDDFFSVYARRMKAHGTPTHGLRWFKALGCHLGDRCTYIVAYKGGRPVAGVLLLFHRKTVTVHYGASVPGCEWMCANNVVYWAALNLAIEKGMLYFDFGRSRFGTGTFKYKMQWGAENRATPYVYVLAKGQSIPHEDPSNDNYSKYARMWKRLPLWATVTLGPLVRKRITT